MDMDDVVAGLATKADKIRALDRAGYTRSQIADFLGIRYQHVRNVLVDDARTGARPAPAGMAEEAPPFQAAPRSPDVRRARRIEVQADGTVTLPAVLLAAVGIPQGGVLLARFDDDEIKMMTPETTTRKIQAEMRKYVPEGVSLVDELIAERRAEAKRELEDD
ncbi:MAG TPA: hypothetical protein VG889_04110 [Rhizomicrobium sp.]|nr:hypothetical protein [Rhizomicrobium sp.]